MKDVRTLVLPIRIAKQRLLINHVYSYLLVRHVHFFILLEYKHVCKQLHVCPLSGGVAQWVARNVEVVGSSHIKGPPLFP